MNFLVLLYLFFCWLTDLWIKGIFALGHDVSKPIGVGPLTSSYWAAVQRSSLRVYFDRQEIVYALDSLLVALLNHLVEFLLARLRIDKKLSLHTFKLPGLLSLCHYFSVGHHMWTFLSDGVSSSSWAQFVIWGPGSNYVADISTLAQNLLFHAVQR